MATTGLARTLASEACTQTTSRCRKPPRRRLRTLGSAVTAGLLVGSVIAAPRPAQAGSGTCNSGEKCVSWVAAGSFFWGFGSNSIYNLNAYTFSNGVPVGNNAGYGRNRDANWARICFYAGTNLTGAQTGSAPWTSSWVLIGQTTESYVAVQPSYCP